MVAYGLVASLLDYYVKFGMYLPSDPTNLFGAGLESFGPGKGPWGSPKGPPRGCREIT